MYNESDFSFQRRLRSSVSLAFIAVVGAVFLCPLVAIVYMCVGLWAILSGWGWCFAFVSIGGFVLFCIYIFCDLSSKEYLQ